MGKSKWEILKWKNGERTKSEAEENAAQILERIIFLDLKKKLNLEEDQSPSIQDLIQNGHQDFVSAFKRHGLRLQDIIKKINLKPRLSTHSWVNLTFESAVEYFIEIIKSNEIPLGPDDLPTRKELRNSKFKNFMSAIDKRPNLTLTEIKDEVRQRLNLAEPAIYPKEEEVQITRKEILKKIQKSEKFSRASEKYYLIEAIKKLLINIIPIVKKKIELKPWHAPSKQQILRCQCEEFLVFLEKHHLSYHEVVELAGRVIIKKKWNGLNVKRAASYLLENILNSDEINILNLQKGEAPSKNQLIKIGYGAFVTAIYKRGMFYSEVVDETGLYPHPKDAAQEAGINSHWILEKIFLQYTREKHLHSYYEIYPSILDHKNHSDNSVLRDLIFEDVIEKKQSLLKMPSSIELINVEYYSGSDIETIIRKCKKDYQGAHKFLIIVSLSTKEKDIKTPNVPFKEHVKIMNMEEFAEFIAYKDQYLMDYYECIELTRKAPWDKDARQRLRELMMEAQKILEERYPFRQQSLETDLGGEKVKQILRASQQSEKNEKGGKKEKKKATHSEHRSMVLRENITEEGYYLYSEDAWLSATVKESIEKNKKGLLEQVKEEVERKSEDIGVQESQRYYDREELEPELLREKQQEGSDSILEEVEENTIKGKEVVFNPEYDIYSRINQEFTDKSEDQVEFESIKDSSFNESHFYIPPEKSPETTSEESQGIPQEEIPYLKPDDIEEFEPEEPPDGKPEDNSEYEPEDPSEVENDDISELEPEEEDYLEPDDMTELNPEEPYFMEPDEQSDLEPEEEYYLEPDDISELEPEESPHVEPDETPDAEPDDTSELGPDETPDTEHDDISDLDPDETPDTEHDDISDLDPDEFPDTDPEGNPEPGDPWQPTDMSPDVISGIVS
ncbi:MAG: hypothetical protein ACFFCI_16435, partial [Promethearchaeota archaeon]